MPKDPCCLYGNAPSYLADLITPSAAATVRPGLRSAASSSATNYIISWRPVLCGGWPTCMEQTSTTASSRLFCCYFQTST